jgi:hypothetical protein
MSKNKHGNLIATDFHEDRDRYFYDFGICQSWTQYDTDQDAWYFGIWVNQEKLQILTFAEGDETLTTCLNEVSFHAELADMAAFYGAPPPAFKSISEDGTVTEYFDERPA